MAVFIGAYQVFLLVSLLFAVRVISHSSPSEEQPTKAEQHAAAAAPTCTATDQSLCNFDLRSIEFWKKLALDAGVDLHVGEELEPNPLGTHNVSEKQAEKFRNKMRRDGYFTFDNFKGDRFKTEAAKFVKLNGVLNGQLGLPTTFVTIYDEMWEVISALASQLEPITGVKRNGEIYIFNVKPGMKGWQLHRDGEKNDWIISFNKEEPYNNLSTWHTVWLPLTDSVLETSAMYALPAFCDPEYADLTHPTGIDASMAGREDSLDHEQIVMENHRHIRALDTPLGTALVWSHRLLHWSSTPPDDAPHARLSLVFGLAKPEKDPSRLKGNDSNNNTVIIPTFEQRLALMTCNCVHYNFNFHAPLPTDILYQLVTILSDPRFGGELSDFSIRPKSDVWESLPRMYFGEEALREPILAFARYVVNDRGLVDDGYFAVRLVTGDKAGLAKDYNVYLRDIELDADLEEEDAGEELYEEDYEEVDEEEDYDEEDHQEENYDEGDYIDYEEDEEGKDDGENNGEQIGMEEE